MEVIKIGNIAILIVFMILLLLPIYTIIWIIPVEFAEQTGFSGISEFIFGAYFGMISLLIAIIMLFQDKLIAVIVLNWVSVILFLGNLVYLLLRITSLPDLPNVASYRTDFGFYIYFTATLALIIISLIAIGLRKKEKEY